MNTIENLSSEERLAKIAEHYKAIIELLGEDVNREGLIKTPLRIAKAMQFMTQGYFPILKK